MGSKSNSQADSTSNTTTTSIATNQQVGADGGSLAFGADSQIGGNVTLESVDSEVIKTTLDAGNEFGEKAFGFGGEALRIAQQSTGDAIAFAEGSGREALNFGRDSLEASGEVTRNALAFAEDSGKQSFDFAEGFSHLMSEDQKDNRLFAEGVSARAMDIAQRAGLEQGNLARQLSETAIQKLSDNKKDPESRTLETFAKYGALATVAVVGVVILTKK